MQKLLLALHLWIQSRPPLTLCVPFNVIMSAFLNTAYYFCPSRTPQTLIYTSLDSVFIYASNDISCICFPPLVQYLSFSMTYTPGEPSRPHAGESVTQEMKTGEVQADICARHVLCVMGIVCRDLWVQRPWWLGGEGWASLCITCPLEVRLDSKVMHPLKETCYEIHGWNKSGANMCALVEECLVLHGDPCVMAHILESVLPVFAAWTAVPPPVRAPCCGAAAPPPRAEAQRVSTPVSIMLVLVCRPRPPWLKKDLEK